MEFLEINPNFYQTIKYDNGEQPILINENDISIYIFILEGFQLTENLLSTELETDILDN